jgi:hypothetical protein
MSGQDRDPARPARGVRLFPALGAVVLLGLAVCFSRQLGQPAAGLAQGNDPAQERVKLAVAAAKQFLATLDEKARARALGDFNDPKKRTGWSNLPVTMVKRNGVRMGDLTHVQRDAAMDLLKAVLSKEGYQKVIDIMNSDQALADKGGGKGGKGGGKKGGKGPPFGNNEYYLALFGTPSPTTPWFVQFGGHHLGVNVTLVGKTAVLEPTHTGTQPDKFKRAGQTVRPLGPENDKAFALINALDDKQKEQAILGKKAMNLQVGPGQDGKKIEPRGVKVSTFTVAQKDMLLGLIGEWVNILPGDAARARMRAIKDKLDDTYFAWSGPTTNGSPVYFRVQGPTLIIEYAPQQGVDHIHTILRDPTDDYGQKILEK